MYDILRLAWTCEPTCEHRKSVRKFWFCKLASGDLHQLVRPSGRGFMFPQRTLKEWWIETQGQWTGSYLLSRIFRMVAIFKLLVISGGRTKQTNKTRNLVLKKCMSWCKSDTRLYWSLVCENFCLGWQVATTRDSKKQSLPRLCGVATGKGPLPSSAVWNPHWESLVTVYGRPFATVLLSYCRLYRSQLRALTEVGAYKLKESRAPGR